MRLMVSLVASLALAGVGLFTTACGKSITEPSPVTTKSSGGTHPTVAATPSTTASPDPTNSATTDAPEVVYQGAQFIVHNPTGHDVVYRMCFYQMSEPYTFQNQHFLGQSLNVTAPKQTSDTVIPIPELPIACGKTIVVQADPWKGGTECPTDPRSIDERGTPNITLRGPDCRCDDYEKPSITGDIAMVVDTDAGVAHITRGSVAPAAVSLNPALPVDITQPAYGQPATEFSTTGTLSFGPAELQCSVSKPFTKTVPPQEHVRDCEDMAAHCSAVSVNTSDIIATVKTTCTWTPPPPTGLLQLPEYATTVAPGEMHPYDVARTSHAQTINISLKLSGQVCATASAVVEAKRCEEAQSGIVTVKADTHSQRYDQATKECGPRIDAKLFLRKMSDRLQNSQAPSEDQQSAGNESDRQKSFDPQSSPVRLRADPRPIRFWDEIGKRKENSHLNNRIPNGPRPVGIHSQSLINENFKIANRVATEDKWNRKTGKTD
jgi:hypothetical protein